MLFSLEVRRARKGDCLLLHFGSPQQPRLMLIDGGPATIYATQLKPRLRQLQAARNAQKPVPVDLLMISHVDDDHIQGILDLTGEELAAQLADRPQLLEVQGFWHNSFDDLIGNDADELASSVRRSLGPAALLRSRISPQAAARIEQRSSQHPEVVRGSLKVLASIAQGFSVRQNAEQLGYPRNPQFGGQLVAAKKGGKKISFSPGLKLTVAGPMQAELNALQKAHRAWLRKQRTTARSPLEALAAYVDKSVPNLSSIVVLAEAGGKRMLLTGDARGDKILAGLQLAGALAAGKKSKLKVDLLKVPHHGSANNLDDDFFERIIADHYVFSGNGEHGNPEREALQMLLDARGEENYQLHLTYPVKEIDAARKKDWEKERAKEKKLKATNPSKKVRPAWSAPQHSLAALLSEHPAVAARIAIVPQNAPHLINLLEPLEV